MLINHTKRFFMNEEGASPGGGAITPAPAAPATPTAPEAPKYLTVDQLDEKLAAFQNGFFANARKAGLLGKDKPSADTTVAPSAATPSAAAPATSGLTEADLEARLEQERVITRVQVENKLSDAAVKRMKSALKTEKPDDIGSWTTSYLADLGLVRTNEPSTTTTPAPAIPAAPNTAPISDRGSPAPSGAVGWRHELQEKGAFGISKAAREQMDAELGVEKARAQRLALGKEQAERMKVIVTPRG